MSYDVGRLESLEILRDEQESKISKLNARLGALACRAEKALPAGSAQAAGT